MTDETPTTGESDVSVEKAAMLERLEGYTLGVETTAQTVPFDQTEQLEELLDEARIIGLGESTHGTREFFELKSRLVRYLVREQGLRVVALEANLPEALALDDYVRDGVGDPKSALDNIYFWTWNVQSVLDLVEWLREFNDDRPPADRVSVHGFDAQYTSGAVGRLRSFFDRAGFDLPADLDEDLDTVDDDGQRLDESVEMETYLDAAKRVVSRLRTVLEDNQSTLVSATDERAVDRTHRLVTVIEQATVLHEVQTDIDEENDEAMQRAIRIRDESMAENVEWLLDYENVGQIALWGHDAHINRRKHPFRHRDIESPSMGKHLAEDHGEEYVAVGFTFGSGTFQALSESSTDSEGESVYELQGQAVESPVEGTIDEKLSQLDESVALLDIRAAVTDETLSSWLDQKRETFSAGATYEPGSPETYVNDYVFSEAFDVLCYIEETTRARPVDADLPDP